MNVTNQNPENDSLKIIQNEDGSFTMDWDPNDPKWSWLNQLTTNEIQIMIKQAIQNEIEEKNYGS